VRRPRRSAARPSVGSQFVDLKYENGTLAVGSEKYAGKWVVCSSTPLDFTFVCPTEIIAFSDRIEEFEKIGAKVIGASVDSQYTHLAWKNTPRNKGGLGEIRYPLLSDLNRQAAAAYDVLLQGGVAARGIFIMMTRASCRATRSTTSAWGGTWTRSCG